MSDDYTTTRFGFMPGEIIELPYSPERVVEAYSRLVGPPRIEVRANAWLEKGSAAFIRPDCWMVSTDVLWALEEGVPIAYAMAACKRAAKRDEWERLMKAFEGRDRRFLGVRDGHPGGGRAARRRGEARKRARRRVERELVAFEQALGMR